MNRWACIAFWALACVGCGEADPAQQAEAAFDAKDYPKAATLFKAALAQADPADAPALRARLGLTLSLAGDVDGAQAALEGAISSGNGAVAALAHRYLGRIHTQAGRLKAATQAYDTAYAWLLENGPENELLKLQVNRAALAWSREEFEHAWTIYADVYQRALRLEDPMLQANGLDGLGMLLSHAGEFQAADRLHAQAVQMYEAKGNSASIGASMGNRALAALAQGTPESRAAARTYLGKLQSAAQSTSMAMLNLQAMLIDALIAHEDGDWERAVRQADAVRTAAPGQGGAFFVEEADLVALKALIKGRRWDDFERRAQAYAPRRGENQAVFDSLRARAALHAKKPAEARRLLMSAVERFEGFRRLLGAEHLGAAFIWERAQAYEQLLSLLVEANEVQAALKLIGRIKARSFANALRSRPTQTAGDKSIGLPDGRTVQRARLRFSIEPIPEAVEPTAVQSKLPPDVALIEYYALDDQLLIFWIDAQRIEMARVKIAAQELRTTVAATLNGVRRSGVEHLAPIAKLGKWLLDPIAERLNDAGPDRILVVVPHGPLHPIPFEALPWAGELLVDRFPVVSAANLTAVHRALTQPVQAPGSTLAVGDPRKNLPGARHEAEEVAKRFDGRALLGAAARESVVRKAMRDADLLHFAVHGIRPVPNAPAYLQLAPDSSEDGQLHADELAASQLKANLVVLSVCDSARGQPNKGDEIVGVIDRAFLQAGARSVVASRWPVHDAASVLFMREFYARLRAKKPVIRAFHGAQLALRRKQAHPAQLGPLLEKLDGSRVRGLSAVPDKPLPKDFAHPYFWAAFSLRGAWQ
jgi:CHAT domain-containing protein